jgi:hypothetical protein
MSKVTPDPDTISGSLGMLKMKGFERYLNLGMLRALILANYET